MDMEEEKREVLLGDCLEFMKTMPEDDSTKHNFNHKNKTP
jgi:DNA modification methylase